MSDGIGAQVFKLLLLPCSSMQVNPANLGSVQNSSPDFSRYDTRGGLSGHVFIIAMNDKAAEGFFSMQQRGRLGVFRSGLQETHIPRIPAGEPKRRRIK